MDIKTTHKILIEADPEDIEALEPVIKDIATLISAVENQGPATKTPIVDECRDELMQVMQEESDERIASPGDMLDILATYEVIEKHGEKFRSTHID